MIPDKLNCTDLILQKCGLFYKFGTNNRLILINLIRLFFLGQMEWSTYRDKHTTNKVYQIIRTILEAVYCYHPITGGCVGSIFYLYMES